MKKILVTGGSGFIGGYVLRHFASRGYTVSNFDLKPCCHKGTSFIQGSILDFSAVRMAVNEADIIFHFAGFSNINLVREHPRDCIEFNVMGTLNFLESLRLKGEGTLVFASSVYVHDTKGHLYTTSKWTSEMLCRNYRDLYRLPSTMLRIGTVYGEKSRHEDVVSLFARRAAQGMPIIIHGSGEQTRHFIHGEDIAAACEHIMEKSIADQTLVLAGPQEVSINRLADIIQQQEPTTIIQREIGFGREDDYGGDIGTLEETRRILGWTPQINIEEGVERLIRHFRRKESE